MSILDVKESYLRTNNYRPELDNFFDYMVSERFWNNDDTIFNGISTIDIIKSLEYNIRNVPYSAKSIARKYSVVICNFFLYAMEQGYVRNIHFYNELVAKRISDNSYYNKINTFISEHKDLKDTEQNKAFSTDEMNLLIEECDSFLDDANNVNNIVILGACLCVKLVALLGLKYSVARRIKYNDFDGDSIWIKEFRIHLPI